MSREGFDYGAEPVKGAGGFKQPEVGETTGRVRSIIHLGTYEKVWKGKKQAPAPFVAVIFELHGQFEDDEETPLTTSIAFPLKKGNEKAAMIKFLNAVDPKEETSGFGDCITRPLSLNMEGSKEKDEDGKPKYVNCKSISAVPASILKMKPELLAEVLPALKEEGVGFVKFEDMTKEAMLELNPYLHINLIMEKATNFKGSKAESILAEIRKEDPKFGISDDKEESKSTNSEDTPPPPDMSETQEY